MWHSCQARKKVCQMMKKKEKFVAVMTVTINKNIPRVKLVEHEEVVFLPVKDS